MTRLLVLGILLTACGGQLAETPEERFVEAACLHVGCKGWATDVETCEVSFRAAVAKSQQDATCLDAATAVLERSMCGDETNTAADAVVDGKCAQPGDG